ncbi:MAG: [Fe-Fe] hydrogenase large subunit C-terminal domain-containing protein [Bacteroidales bacterium]|nr:[Fe-Fe] hydrogenase large subunit C-terminal domain-containing protein [Bacteroidales bacterium]HNW72813.1 [Fe-Fe] hydrogenase large subunit C-terminal domain-containing protein [Bacteroidales bacterium]
MIDEPLFRITHDQCIKCYSCVRICPVKAIRVDVNTEFPSILPERCIGCGSCYRACSTQAISYRSSIEQTIELLHSGEPVAAICDPAISGEFHDITDYRKFVGMIRELGFTYVSEVSFGVDLIASRYKELLDNFRGKYYFTSNCPSVVAFIEKYHPELINNLAPLVSPMIATARVIRQRYGSGTRIVFIGPCIATKDEALRFTGESAVDAVLTFVELRQLFAQFNIRESQLEYFEFDPPLGQKGSLYPISNGILQAVGINEDLLSGSVITTEGRINMTDAVREFESRIDLIKRNFNIFYDEGCIMGPGTSPKGEKFLRMTLVKEYANKRLKTLNLDDWQHDVNSFEELDLSRQFIADDQRLPVPDEEKIAEVLKMIERESHLHGDVGCESCGYSSCRDLAIAISQGLATTDMCHVFSGKNRQEYIQTLRTTNENLAKTKIALKESEEKAKHEQEAQKETSEIISTMLQKLISGVVIVDENLKIYQSNKAFIRIVGEEATLIDEVIPGLVGADLKSLLPIHFYKMFTYVLSSDESIENRDVQFGDNKLGVSIFPLRSHKYVGGILRDRYMPELQKEQIVNRLQEVIDENFDMVQKIAYLLGEGAAKSEQMLNSVIETYSNPPGKRQ